MSSPRCTPASGDDEATIRSDENGSGFFWAVELPGGHRAHGYAETRSEAETLIDQYRQAAIRELRRRGPRTVWNAPCERI